METRPYRYKPVLVITPEGKELKFTSRNEAAEYFGKRQCVVSRAIKTGWKLDNHIVKEGMPNEIFG